MYGLRQYGLSNDEAKQCMSYVASQQALILKHLNLIAISLFYNCVSSFKFILVLFIMSVKNAFKVECMFLVQIRINDIIINMINDHHSYHYKSVLLHS